MKKHLLLLFAALLPLVASAQTKVEIDGIWYNLISKGKVAEVTYKGDSYSYYDEYSGSITLPATVYDGVAYSVTSIGNEAFRGCRSLTAITIPEGVTSIGGSAFYKCSSLTAITLPEGMTSIGQSAFFGCESLTAITIPEGVTSMGSAAFRGCSSLTAITIPEGVTRIKDGAFQGCSSLTDVYCNAEEIPYTDTEAFYESNIENATLHVPASAVNSYKNTAPWSSFGKVETLEITVDEITLSQSAAELIEGESLQLTATVSPDDATDKTVTWSSSDERIASVDTNGVVTAIAPGTATITATANDGSGVSASCEVTVTPASYVITYLIDGEVFLTDTLTRDSAISLPNVPTKEGYTFSGWGDVPETMPAEDVTATGTFIPNKYLVTFKIGDEVVAADSLEYKSAIVAPEAPEKEGYTFNGWGVVADSVPAHDLTYEGSYSINSYVLTYVVDGEAVLTLPIVYGATIPSLKAPEKEGYTFSGWSEAPETMPAEDVTIEGTFTQLPSVYLTINQADNGCVKQHLVVGTVCTYTIEATEGWNIHSVTFNGEDVTSQLTEEGTFTTPTLIDDATLNIAYEKIDNAITSATAKRIKAQGYQGIISITGTTEGTDISLYTTDGTLVTRETAEGDTTHLTVPTGQVYIVKVADTVVKIGM